MEEFILDSKLEKDSLFICDLALCQIRLINDSRWFWLILVPKRNGIREICDLHVNDYMLMVIEMYKIVELMKKQCDKVNMGTLGNIVNQLHLHVIGRNIGDDGWPGPVWGYGEKIPYQDPLAKKNEVLTILKNCDEFNLLK